MFVTRAVRYGKLLLIALTLGVAACEGDDGKDGPPGPRGLPEATALDIEITEVTIASAPVVRFKVTDQNGIGVIGVEASNLRFTLARLDTSVTPNAWVSYVNRTETEGATTVIQATRDQGGELEDNQDGSYRYTFSTDITNVTTPVPVTYNANATHRLGIQTRGGLPTVNATFDWVPATGATTGIPRRDIVKTETCNSCHNRLEAHDGREQTKYCVTCHNPGSTDAQSGNTVDFKVMIHKIHRGENLPSVVLGPDLTPSTGDDGTGVYQIVGFRNTLHDFSDVVFPQDIRACATCHVPDPDNAPQAGNWESNPNIEACGACHDNIDFTKAGFLAGVVEPGEPNGHPGGVVDNSMCTNCHVPGGLVPIATSHTIPERVAADRFEWNILEVRDTAPGQQPTVQFSVTDPTNNDAPYDIINDPAFTAGGGVSRMAILIGWDSRDHAGNPQMQVDFDNAPDAGASPTSPAQPISINPLGGNATNIGGNIFEIISPTALPNLVGTQLVGVVAIEGHPAAQDTQGNYTLRVPVASVIEEFSIAGAVKERRQVVSTEKCNACHFALSMHGANRNLADELMCVVCHNSDATDMRRRPKTANPSAPATNVPGEGVPDADAALDDKPEESIDIKRMIHAIHAGAETTYDDEPAHGIRERGYVAYGFGNRLHDFSHVRFPGILNDCETCHLEGTYELLDTWELPTTNGILSSTMQSAPAVNADPANSTIDDLRSALGDSTDDINRSPTAAVCSACHDSAVAQAHMALNGAFFDETQTNIDGTVEACAVCHGPGRSAAVALVHAVD